MSKKWNSKGMDNSSTDVTTHPKSVPYPEPIKAHDTLGELIFAHAAGVYIRDVAHRPSVPDVEFEKMARMAIQAAKLFRKTQESDASG